MSRGTTCMTVSYHYLVETMMFGVFSVVWQEKRGKCKIVRIILSENQDSAYKSIQNIFPAACQSSNRSIIHQVKLMQSFLSGQAVKFDLELLALENCSHFQQRVLLAESRIPRGWISTYGRIGKHIGVNKGARTVGNALARNPFPIIIPCHRAIRSDMTLGGYQGGMKMKRALLELEGIKISKTGKVIVPRYYY